MTGVFPQTSTRFLEGKFNNRRFKPWPFNPQTLEVKNDQVNQGPQNVSRRIGKLM